MKEKSYLSRKEQAVLTKKKIFDTTVLLMKKKGYSKITIREICQNAEISVGTFYLYFLSKDDILLDIYNKLLQTFPEASFPQEPGPEGTASAVRQVVWRMDWLLQQLEGFDKDLLQEIYRINLSVCRDSLLHEDSPLYQSLVEVFGSQPARDGAYAATPEQLARKTAIFVQGYVMHWLVEECQDFAQMRQECLQELERYLGLYCV